MGNQTRKFRRQQGVGYSPTERERKMLQALQSASMVLKQYANGSNWANQDGKAIWLGEGDGPDLAAMVLGVKAARKAEQKLKEGQPDGA